MPLDMQKLAKLSGRFCNHSSLVLWALLQAKDVFTMMRLPGEHRLHLLHISLWPPV